MYSPNTAIFDPFLYTVALAENALHNGVQFYLNTEVTGIDRQAEGFCITTNCGTYSSKMLINCAGLFSDKISDMAGVTGYHIYPCRGEYLILVKIAKDYLDIPVYPAPTPGLVDWVFI